MIDWEPIETAPRDGSPLLLWLPAPLSKPAIGHWNQTLFCWVVEDGNLGGAMNVAIALGVCRAAEQFLDLVFRWGDLPGRLASRSRRQL